LKKVLPVSINELPNSTYKFKIGDIVEYVINEECPKIATLTSRVTYSVNNAYEIDNVGLILESEITRKLSDEEKLIYLLEK
jgi:hypothetical protein